MNENQNNTLNRATMVNTLAVIGFVALIVASMWLAVYSTRYVPDVVGRIGSAAVYLGSVFTPAEEPTLSVVPTVVASTTLPFDDSSSTSASSTVSKPVTLAKPDWTPGAPVAVTNNTVVSPSLTTQPYSGLPDLAVVIETVGYMATDGSIVPTTTIPAHMTAAVKFRVTNIGTNVSGPWTLNYSISNGGTTEIRTASMNSLVPTEPNGAIAYFSDIIPGAGRIIVITADPSHQLTEISTTNNVASTTVTILGT